MTYANFEHINCSGGDVRARVCGIDPLVTRTVSANPDINSMALKKTLNEAGGGCSYFLFKCC